MRQNVIIPVGLAVMLGLTVSCSDYTVTHDVEYVRPTYLGSISGRVCSASGAEWLPDAHVYVNETNEDDQVIGLVEVYSDRNGRWMLQDLMPDIEYTVYVQYGSELLATHSVFIANGEDVVLDEPSCFDPLSLDIALIKGDYDDINIVLESLGFANYRSIDGTSAAAITEFLTDLDQMRAYDVIFFNGGHVEQGIFYDVNTHNELPVQIISNLRTYVEEGGSVYGSDWAYDVIELAWPDAIDFLGDDNIPNSAQLGEYDSVNAGVTDEALALELGTTSVNVSYDLPVWPPIERVEGYVSVHLTGTVHYNEGADVSTLANVPLLVSFSGGYGRVGYATFRVVANHSQEMVDTLRYMLHEI
jgi:hypothetical protein